MLGVMIFIEVNIKIKIRAKKTLPTENPSMIFLVL
jgi:hypothetical protein